MRPRGSPPACRRRRPHGRRRRPHGPRSPAPSPALSPWRRCRAWTSSTRRGKRVGCWPARGGEPRRPGEQAEAADAVVAEDKRQGRDARGVAQTARRAWEQASAALAEVERQEAAWQRARAALAVFDSTGAVQDRGSSARELEAVVAELSGPQWKRVRNFLGDPRSLAFLGPVAGSAGRGRTGRRASPGLGAAVVAAPPAAGGRLPCPLHGHSHGHGGRSGDRGVVGGGYPPSGLVVGGRGVLRAGVGGTGHDGAGFQCGGGGSTAYCGCSRVATGR